MKSKIKSNLILFALTFLFTLLSLILIYDFVVKKYLISVYISECENMCEQVIYDEIEKYIEKSDIKTKDIMTVVNSEDGSVSAYVSDDIMLNKLKTDLITDLNNVIDEMDNETVEIKIGGLTNNAFFIGRGPSMKIRFNPSGNVSGKLVKHVKSIGINQINYTVEAEFVVNIVSKTNFFHINIDVPIEYNLIDTIILDDTPGIYAR